MSIINAKVSAEDLKFVGLKSYQLSPANQNGSGKCLAVDHKNQTIFVCCKNEIIYTPLVSLLNFDTWSKEFLKRAHDVFDKVTVPISSNHLESHLISISCKGYGTKLAVACQDFGRESLFLFFYHLPSLYELRDKATSYNCFKFPINSTTVKVRYLSWHPEMNDNVIACSLTDGSFYILYVGDYGSKIITLILNLTDRNVSAFSWSPKGKQIVMAFNGSCVVQHKLQLNEANLVQSTNFQEAKRIELPDNFSKHRIINVFWLSTLSFVMICRNGENDSTNFFLVSIPSAKATGPDAVMKIIDFGNLILESIQSNDPYEAELFPLDNVIFIYSNKTNDFAMIGCNPNETNVCENWAEIVWTDDDCRLVVNCTDGMPESVLIRGLNFTHGIPKQFKMPWGMTGGPNKPVALTYNSDGQLFVFVVDFENTNSEQRFLRIPAAPKTVKPKVNAAAVQNVSAQIGEVMAPVNPVKSFQPLHPMTNSPTVQSPLVSALASKPVAHQPIQSQSMPSIKPTANASFAQTSIVTQQSKELASTFAPKVNCAKKPSEPVTDKPSEAATDWKNLNQYYALLYIKEFEQELKSSVTAIKESLTKTEIGYDQDFENVKFKTEFIMQMLKKLESSYNLLSVDVNDLKASCLELQYLWEETHSLLDRNIDPKYRYMLQQKNLDPLTTKRLKEIATMKDYVDIQLRELGAKFDMEWQEWLQQQKQKKRSSSSLLSINSGSKPTSPFTSFITESNSNQEDNVHEKNVPRILCKTLQNNQRLIDSLREKIKAMVMSPDKKHDLQQENVQDMIKMFKNMPLGTKQYRIDHNKTITVQCLPTEKKLSLKSFLEDRHSVPTRVCRPLGDGDKQQRSKFLSVLEKIKSKEGDAKKKLLEDLQNAQRIPTTTENQPVKRNVEPTSKSESKKSEEPFSSGSMISKNTTSTSTSTSVTPISSFSFSMPSFSTSMFGTKTDESQKKTESGFSFQLNTKNTNNQGLAPQQTTSTFTTSIFTFPTQLKSSVDTVSKLTVSSNQEQTSPETTSFLLQQSNLKSNEDELQNNNDSTTTIIKMAEKENNNVEVINEISKPSLLAPNKPNDNLISASISIAPTTTTVATSTITSSAVLNSKNQQATVSNFSFPTTVTASSTPVTSTNASLFTTTTLKSPEFPAFTSSLFGDSPATKPNTVEEPKKDSNGFAATPAVTAEATITAGIKPEANSFSFGGTLSALSLSPTSATTTTTTSSTTGSNIFTTVKPQQQSIFGSPAIASPFGQVASPVSQSSNLFGSNNQTSLFKPCSPEQPNNTGSVFSAPFKFAGASPTSPSTGTGLFGTEASSESSIFSPKPSTASSPPATGSLFSSGSFTNQNQQAPLFQPLNSGSPPGSTFGAFNSTSPQQPASGFGGPAVFGGSPSFGAPPAFGGQPSFGGFSGAMNQSLPSFGQINTKHSFGSNAFKNEPMPSFGSLASDANPGVGSFGSGGGGGGHLISTSFSQNSDAFTQRRG